jgi:hypothetical protein
MKMKIVLFVALCHCGVLLRGQIIYTQTFTDELSAANAVCESLKGGFYNIVPVVSDSYFDYDLILESEVEDMELRYVIEPDYIPNIGDIPSVHQVTVSTNLAYNSDMSLVSIVPLSAYRLKQMGASWGSVSFFQPKTGISERKSSRLLTLYGLEKGRIHVIIFYNRDDPLIRQRLYSLRFSQEE